MRNVLTCDLITVSPITVLPIPTAPAGVAAAVALARVRVRDLANVEVVQAWIPESWPCSPLDLVALSELGYFVSQSESSAVIECIKRSLTQRGMILACHWRHPIQGYPLDTASGPCSLGR